MREGMKEKVPDHEAEVRCWQLKASVSFGDDNDVCLIISGVFFNRRRTIDELLSPSR